METRIDIEIEIMRYQEGKRGGKTLKEGREKDEWMDGNNME
jgi:hypothetical protein